LFDSAGLRPVLPPSPGTGSAIARKLQLDAAILVVVSDAAKAGKAREAIADATDAASSQIVDEPPGRG